MVSLPVLLTCFAAMPARLSRALAHTDFFSPVSASSAAAISPFVRDFAAAFIAFGAISGQRAGCAAKASGESNATEQNCLEP